MKGLFVGVCKIQAVTTVSIIFWTTGCSQRELYFYQPSKQKQRFLSIWDYNNVPEPEPMPSETRNGIESVDSERGLNTKFGYKRDLPKDYMQNKWDTLTQVDDQIRTAYEYDTDYANVLKEGVIMATYQRVKALPLSEEEVRYKRPNYGGHQMLKKNRKHQRRKPIYVKPVFEEASQLRLFDDLRPQPLDVLLQVNPVDADHTRDRVYDYEYYGFDVPSRTVELEEARLGMLALPDGDRDVGLSGLHLSARVRPDYESLPNVEFKQRNAPVQSTVTSTVSIKPTVGRVVPKLQESYSSNNEEKLSLTSQLKDTNFELEDMYEDDDDESDLDESEMEERDDLMMSDVKTESVKADQYGDKGEIYETILNDEGIEEPVFDMSELEVAPSTMYQKARNKYMDAKMELVRKLTLARQRNLASEDDDDLNISGNEVVPEDEDYTSFEDYVKDSEFETKQDINKETANSEPESLVQYGGQNSFGVNGEVITGHSNVGDISSTNYPKMAIPLSSRNVGREPRDEDEWVVEFFEDFGTTECRQNLHHFCHPVDGGWSQWSEWKCNEPCGGGFVQRARECVNPLPAYGGRDCVGDDAQWLVEEPCSGKACPFSPLPEEMHSVITQEMKMESRNIEIADGERAYIPCSSYWAEFVLETYPASRLVWYHNNKVLDFQPEKMTYERGVLMLKSVKSPDDNGVYYCQLELPPIDKQVVRLTALTIDAGVAQYTLTAGKPWQLQCSGAILGQLYPNAKQKWLLNDEVYTSFNNTNPAKTNDLVINNVTSHLAGQWKCVITAKDKRWIINKFNVLVSAFGPPPNGLGLPMDKQDIWILIAAGTLFLIVAIICFALFLISYKHLKVDMIGMQPWERGALRNKLLLKIKSEDPCHLIDFIPAPQTGKVCELENALELARLHAETKLFVDRQKYGHIPWFFTPKSISTTSSSSGPVSSVTEDDNPGTSSATDASLLQKEEISHVESATQFSESKHKTTERKSLAKVNGNRAAETDLLVAQHVIRMVCRDSIEKQLTLRLPKPTPFKLQPLADSKRLPLKSRWMRAAPGVDTTSSSTTSPDDKEHQHVHAVSHNHISLSHKVPYLAAQKCSSILVKPQPLATELLNKTMVQSSDEKFHIIPTTHSTHVQATDSQRGISRVKAHQSNQSYIASSEKIAIPLCVQHTDTGINSTKDTFCIDIGTKAKKTLEGKVVSWVQAEPPNTASTPFSNDTEQSTANMESFTFPLANVRQITSKEIREKTCKTDGISWLLAEAPKSVCTSSSEDIDQKNVAVKPLTHPHGSGRNMAASNTEKASMGNNISWLQVGPPVCSSLSDEKIHGNAGNIPLIVIRTKSTSDFPEKAPKDDTMSWLQAGPTAKVSTSSSEDTQPRTAHNSSKTVFNAQKQRTVATEKRELSGDAISWIQNDPIAKVSSSSSKDTQPRTAHNRSKTVFHAQKQRTVATEKRELSGDAISWIQNDPIVKVSASSSEDTFLGTTHKSHKTTLPTQMQRLSTVDTTKKAVMGHTLSWLQADQNAKIPALSYDGTESCYALNSPKTVPHTHRTSTVATAKPLTCNSMSWLEADPISKVSTSSAEDTQSVNDHNSPTSIPRVHAQKMPTATVSTSLPRKTELSAICVNPAIFPSASTQKKSRVRGRWLASSMTDAAVSSSSSGEVAAILSTDVLDTRKSGRRKHQSINYREIEWAKILQNYSLLNTNVNERSPENFVQKQGMNGGKTQFKIKSEISSSSEGSLQRNSGNILNPENYEKRSRQWIDESKTDTTLRYSSGRSATIIARPNLHTTDFDSVLTSGGIMQVKDQSKGDQLLKSCPKKGTDEICLTNVAIRSLGPTSSMTKHVRSGITKLAIQSEQISSKSEKNQRDYGKSSPASNNEIDFRKRLWKLVMNELVYKVKGKTIKIDMTEESMRYYIKSNDELLIPEIQSLKLIKLCPCLSSRFCQDKYKKLSASNTVGFSITRLLKISGNEVNYKGDSTVGIHAETKFPLSITEFHLLNHNGSGDNKEFQNDRCLASHRRCGKTGSDLFPSFSRTIHFNMKYSIFAASPSYNLHTLWMVCTKVMHEPPQALNRSSTSDGPQQRSQGSSMEPGTEATSGNKGSKSTPSSNNRSNKNSQKPCKSYSQASWTSTLFSWFYKEDDSKAKSCLQSSSNNNNKQFNGVIKASEQPCSPCPDAKDKFSLNNTPHGNIFSRTSNGKPDDGVKEKTRQDVGTSPRWMLVTPQHSVKECSATNDAGCSPIQEFKVSINREEQSSWRRSLYKPDYGAFPAISSRTNSTVASRSPIAYRPLPKAKRIQWSLACKGVPLVGIALAPCENRSTGTEDLEQYCPCLSPIESEFSPPIPLTGLARTPMPEVLLSRPSSQSSKVEILGYKNSRPHDFDSRTVILGPRSPISELQRTMTPMTDVVSVTTPRSVILDDEVPKVLEEVNGAHGIVSESNNEPKILIPDIPYVHGQAFEHITQSPGKQQQSSSFSQQSTNTGRQQAFNRSGNRDQTEKNRSPNRTDKTWGGKFRADMKPCEQPKAVIQAKKSKNIGGNFNSTPFRKLPPTEFEKNPYGIHIQPYETCHYCPPIVNPNLVRCTDPPPIPTGGVLEYHPAQDVSQDSYRTAAEILQQQFLATRNITPHDKECENNEASGDNEDPHGFSGPQYHYHVPDYRQSGFRPISSKQVKMLQAGRSFVKQPTKPPNAMKHEHESTKVSTEKNHKRNQLQQQHRSRSTCTTEAAQGHHNQRVVKDSKPTPDHQLPVLIHATPPVVPPSPPPMPLLLTKPPNFVNRADQKTLLSSQLQSILSMKNRASPMSLHSQERGQKQIPHSALVQKHKESAVTQDENMHSVKERLPRISKMQHIDFNVKNSVAVAKLHEEQNKHSGNYRNQDYHLHETGRSNPVLGHHAASKTPVQTDSIKHSSGEGPTRYPGESGCRAKTGERRNAAARANLKAAKGMREVSLSKRALPQICSDLRARGNKCELRLREEQSGIPHIKSRNPNTKSTLQKFGPKRVDLMTHPQETHGQKDQLRKVPQVSSSNSGDEVLSQDDKRSPLADQLPMQNEIKRKKNRRSGSRQASDSEHSTHSPRVSRGYRPSPRNNKCSKSSLPSCRKTVSSSKSNRQSELPSLPVHQPGRQRFYPKESADLVKECIQSQSGIWYRSDDMYGRPTRSQIAAMVEKTLQSMLRNFTVSETTHCSKRTEDCSDIDDKPRGSQQAHSSPVLVRKTDVLSPKGKVQCDASDGELLFHHTQRTFHTGKKTNRKKMERSGDDKSRQWKAHYQTKDTHCRVRTPYVKPWDSEPQIHSPECKSVVCESRCRSSAGFDERHLDDESETSPEESNEEEEVDDEETEEVSEEQDEEGDESGRTLDASYTERTEREETTECSTPSRSGFRPIGSRENSREEVTYEETDYDGGEETVRESVYSQDELENVLKLDLSKLYNRGREAAVHRNKGNQTYTDSSSRTQSTGFTHESTKRSDWRQDSR